MRLFILSSAILASLATLSTVHAKDVPQYNVINLQAEASRKVSNDEMHAVLYVEKSNKQPALLATEINQHLNQATNIAKKYPSVKLETGSQSTYPIYDENNRKLKEWRGHAQIRLESTDVNSTSQLVSELQQFFQTESIQFGLSNAQRKKIENELLVEASKNFQQRAQSLAQAWNKSSYQLMSFDVNSQNYYPMMATAPMLMKSSMQESDSIPTQNMSAGESTITINATGSIQLK